MIHLRQLPWILASTSKRRQELMRQLNVQFRVESPSNVQELREPPANEKPETMAQINATLKAQAIANKYPQDVILGADTIVVLDGIVYNKPATFEEATKMLKTLSGHQHSVFTAVRILCSELKINHLICDESRVTFQPMSNADIQQYYQKVYPLDKAGGYAIQEALTQQFAHYDGDLTTIIGLPVKRLLTWLDSVQ